MSEDAFAQKLAELGAAFRQQLPDQLAELRQLAADGELSNLRELAHRIAGRGGTFGAAEVTEAAREVELAAAGELAAAIDRLAAAVAALR